MAGQSIDIKAGGSTGSGIGYVALWGPLAAGTGTTQRAAVEIAHFELNNTFFIANTTTTTALLHLNQDGTGDSVLRFSIVGDDWAVGIDNSDSDAFKISRSSVVGTNDALRISSVNSVTWTIPDNNGDPAFAITDGSNQYFTIDTTNAGEMVTVGDSANHGHMQIDEDGHLNYLQSNRGSANDWRVEEENVTTANATPVTIWTFIVPTDTVIYARAVLLARDTTANESAGYELVAMMKNTAGSLAAITANESSDFQTSFAVDSPWQFVTAEDDGTWNAIFSTSGTSLIVQVTGDATNNTAIDFFIEIF